MIGKSLIAAAGNGISTGEVAEAIDFDGTNDELSRASDLTGNADGKTFTFSCWLWRGEIGSNQRIYYSLDSQYGLYIQPDTSNNLIIYGYNAANTQILNATVTVPFQVGFTFMSILISIDMANTANRSVYINDVAATVTWTTYTNAAINFTCPTHKVGQSLKGRLSNVFLDYTYRDLSITANRRLFVTADLKPAAGQAALNPIMYLPMSDPTQPGLNQGTGGNFTLTGTVARSGRGPNQYNAPYSDLDGSADYLSRTTAPTGIADSKTFTFSFCIQPDAVTTNNRDVIAFGWDAANPAFFVRMTSGGEFEMQGYNAAGSVFALGANTGAVFKNGRNYVVTVSVDMSDTGKRHVYINGVAQSVTWTTYSNLTIDFNISTTPKYFIGKGLGTVYYDGRYGALWFNTSYIDLSVAANLAKFVTGTGIDAKPVDLGATGELPTGTSPLIYLPMYGNNAGKNYGTGGDFTVNSGPYTGARGPNEYWGNKMRTTVSSYVGRTSAMTGVANGKKFSCSFFVSQGQAAGGRVLSFVGNTGDSTEYLLIDIDVDGNFSIYGYNSSQVNILALPNMAFGGTATLANVYHVLISVDLSTATYRVYVNGVSKSPGGGIVLTNDNIKFDGGRPSIGAGPVASGNAGDKSEFYFTTDYIDFSQEANRLKFRDAFGNPVDLTQQIEDAAIPNPAIYMRFPPTAFGTNSGTGGDFTVNGTITDGGQL